MIALDTSAIVAIALSEAEEPAFSLAVAAYQALVGVPTLLESRLVLTARMSEAQDFLARFVERPSIHPVAFSLEMYAAASTAFDLFGRGSGHPAKLNFGDCMAYAIAKVHDVPLLYKGDDFSRTDIRAALP
jgi:ribonuclease VapC